MVDEVFTPPGISAVDAVKRSSGMLPVAPPFDIPRTSDAWNSCARSSTRAGDIVPLPAEAKKFEF